MADQNRGKRIQELLPHVEKQCEIASQSLIDRKNDRNDHLWGKHLNARIERLRVRTQREHGDSSSFYGRKSSVIRMIQTLMRDTELQYAIAYWLTAQAPEETMAYEFDIPQYLSAKVWLYHEDTCKVGSEAIIVLGLGSWENRCDFHIKTIYPVYHE